MKTQLTFVFAILFSSNAWGQSRPVAQGYSPIKKNLSDTSVISSVVRNFNRGCTNDAPRKLSKSQEYSSNMLFALPGLWCPNADTTSKNCLKVEQSYPSWTKSLSCSEDRYSLFRKGIDSDQALFACHAGKTVYDVYVGNQATGFVLKGRFNDLENRNCVCSSTSCNRYYWIPTSEQEEEFRREEHQLANPGYTPAPKPIHRQVYDPKQ